MPRTGTRFGSKGSEPCADMATGRVKRIGHDLIRAQVCCIPELGVRVPLGPMSIGALLSFFIGTVILMLQHRRVVYYPKVGVLTDCYLYYKTYT